MGSASSAHKKQVFDGCQMCKIGAKIQWQCLDCNLFLCDRCKYTDHDKFGAHHNIRSENKSSSTIQQAQAPIGCQMCKIGARIQWKCEDCNLAICDRCQYSDHQEFGAQHNIINIKDLGEKAPSKKSKDGNRDNKSKENMDSQEKSSKTDRKYEDKQLNTKFKVVKEYTIDTKNIHYMVVSKDGSLWIGDNYSEKILHIKLSSDSATVLSSFDIEQFSMAISPSGSILVILNGQSTVKIINEKTGQLIDTKFTVQPWILTCIHVTREKNIILGGAKGNKGCVIVMDQNGKELKRYMNNKDKPIVTYPWCIATTRNGNIFIADRPDNNKSRVVRIRPIDRNIALYKGHSDINSEDEPFYPVSILVTPRDNVLIRNKNNDYLHILNNEGDFITYYNLTNIGVIRPYSMVMSPSGNICVGNVSNSLCPPKYQATLYELEFSSI